MTTDEVASDEAVAVRRSFIDRQKIFSDNAAAVCRGATFDVCIAHDVFALDAAHTVARESGAEVWYDATDVPALQGRLGRNLREQPPEVLTHMSMVTRRLIPASKHVVAVGPGIARHVESEYVPTRSPTVVRNVRSFQPPPESDRIRRDLGLAAHERLILYLNLAAPGYGLEDLIRALRWIKADVRVAVLGKVGAQGSADAGDSATAYGKELTRLCEASGVSGRLTFLDPVPPDDVPEYASGADLAAIMLPTEVKNARLALPNRFFDAVMARLPIVSVDIPDIAALIESYGLGKTFPPNDPEGVATAVEHMLEGSRLAEARARVMIAATELCWEREELRLLQLLDTVAADRGHRRVCIVARKNIAHNMRIFRFCRTVLDEGDQVVVIAAGPPERDTPYALPGAVYVRCAQGNHMTQERIERLRSVIVRRTSPVSAPADVEALPGMDGMGEI